MHANEINLMEMMTARNTIRWEREKQIGDPLVEMVVGIDCFGLGYESTARIPMVSCELNHAIS